MRQLPKARALTLALPLALLLAGASCAAAPAATATRRPAAAFVVTTQLPNGRAELTIAPGYVIGTTLTVPIALIVTSGSVTGPVTARVLASGINEGGAPAEVVVRELAVTPVTVSGGRGATSVTWDTKDRKGAYVPADAYSLVLEFRSGDGAGAPLTKGGATLELR